MATSGSITKDSGVILGIKKYILSWSRTGYSVQNNTSTIQWTFKVESNLKSTYNTYYYTININGVQYTGTIGAVINGTTTIRTETMTIQHNSNGSKGFGADFLVDRGGGADKDITASDVIILDVLPRPAAIMTATNFTDEENPRVSFASPASGGTITGTVAACISFDGSTDNIKYRDIDTSTSFYTFNLTDAERKILRQAVTTGNSVQVQFYIRNTIDGQHYWSYLTKTLTLVNYLPTVSPVVKDTNSKTLALTGNESVLIPGHSNAYFNVGASAKKEATIQSQSATCGAIVKTTGTGTFEKVPNNEFTFYCRDSRGDVVYQTYTANIVNYFKVTCNQSTKLNPDGTIDLVVTGKYFTDSFGAKNNTLKIEARSREAGGEWNEWGDISVLLAEASNGTYRLTGTISGFDPSGTYEFQARASDELTSAESAIDSITLKPIFDWGRNDFNFNVPLTIEGNSLDDFVIETGTASMGSNGTWYWRKWKNGRAECYGCRNYGNMAVTTAWGGLYRSGAFTQSFPSGLFVATPEVIDISFRGGSTSGGWIANHENSAPSESETGSFILVRPASATLTGSYLSFNVIGRWK
jgi:hypothetical protein